MCSSCFVGGAAIVVKCVQHSLFTYVCIYMLILVLSCWVLLIGFLVSCRLFTCVFSLNYQTILNTKRCYYYFFFGRFCCCFFLFLVYLYKCSWCEMRVTRNFVLKRRNCLFSFSFWVAFSFLRVCLPFIYCAIRFHSRFLFLYTCWLGVATYCPENICILQIERNWI